MKKSLILLGISTLFILAGCASKIDAVPIQVETESAKGCTDCKEKSEGACAKEVKVVKYSDSCDSCSVFPVTVRKYSTCKNGEEL